MLSASKSENTDDCADDRECIDLKCFTSLECLQETPWKPKPDNIFVVEWDNVDEEGIALK